MGNTFQHTPGPWMVANGTDIFTGLGAVNASGMTAAANDGWQIADCSVGKTLVSEGLVGMPYREQVANAAFIAAAPETARKLAEAEAKIEKLKEALENAEPYWRLGNGSLVAECEFALGFNGD